MHHTCARPLCTSVGDVLRSSPYFGAVIITARPRQQQLRRASLFPFFWALKQCGQRISSNPRRPAGGGTKPERQERDQPGRRCGGATARRRRRRRRRWRPIKTIVSPSTRTRPTTRRSEAPDRSSSVRRGHSLRSASTPLQVNHLPTRRQVNAVSASALMRHWFD